MPPSHPLVFIRIFLLGAMSAPTIRFALSLPLFFFDYVEVMTGILSYTFHNIIFLVTNITVLIFTPSGSTTVMLLTHDVSE